jgi:alkanesulfonate monooxygenase SsuD/methylene tetrahydromethanopterin reductase-like flavin-dependent oxidoreductase (luciferase family)
VVSLPYHNPFMVAERIVQLDHMTRGRVMFGVGPGALQSDARMLGLDASKQRDMMDEALGVIRRLFAGEVVTHESSWFTLREAQLQLARQRDRDRGREPGPARRWRRGQHGAACSIGATTFSASTCWP